MRKGGTLHVIDLVALLRSLFCIARPSRHLPLAAAVTYPQELSTEKSKDFSISLTPYHSLTSKTVPLPNTPYSRGTCFPLASRHAPHSSFSTEYRLRQIGRPFWDRRRLAGAATCAR